MHTLYDEGYIGFDPKFRLVVSPALREQLETGIGSTRASMNRPLCRIEKLRGQVGNSWNGTSTNRSSRADWPTPLGNLGLKFGHKLSRQSGYNNTMRTMSVSEAKDKLSTLVESVEATHEAVVITRHGKPAAILLSPADLESLTETLSWLADPQHRAEVDEAETDIAEGRTLSLDEVRAQLASR